MNFEELTAGLVGASVTGGWDAICAMDVNAVNSVMFQQFANADPANPCRVLQIPVLDGTDLWLLRAALGRPEITFSPSGANVRMGLISGSLTCFNPGTQTITTSLQIIPNTSWLTGPLNLSALNFVETSTGQVKAELGAGAWSPALAGVDPASALSTEIGTAIEAFFANNATSYQLGSYGPSSAPACLTPLSWDVAVMANPEVSGDGCVLMLVKTTGQGGVANPLASYPIPTGLTTALLISNEVLFAGLLASSLAVQLQNTGTSVDASQNGGVWSVTTQGGSFDFGVVCNPNPGSGPPTWFNNTAYPTSCDSADPANVQAVTTTAGGVSLAPSGGNILLTWDNQWDQDWTYVGSVYFYGWVVNPGQAVPMEAKISETFSAGVGPGNVISFSGSVNVSAQATSSPGWFAKYVLGDIDVNQQLSSVATKALEGFFSQLSLPDVATFSLSNLLFPAQHVLNLSSASVPCDLLTTGTLVPPMTVTPSQTVVAPGGTVPFSAELNGGDVEVNWEVTNGPGQVSPQGVYQAPATVLGGELAVVSAIDTSDETQTSSAVVLVAAAATSADVLIAPPLLLVTAGQSYVLTVTDGTGTPIAVTWSAPPAGTIAAYLETGQYIFTAPSTVTAAQTFSLTATASLGPTGSLLVSLAPVASLTVTPASSSVSAGATLAVSADGNFPELDWYVYPVGAGTVAPVDGQLGATYTAPASVPQATTVTLIACGLSGYSGSVGLSTATITVEPV